MLCQALEFKMHLFPGCAPGPKVRRAKSRATKMEWQQSSAAGLSRWQFRKFHRRMPIAKAILRASSMLAHICIYAHPPPTTRGNAFLGAQISTEPQSHRSRNPKNPKLQKSKNSKNPKIQKSENLKNTKIQKAKILHIYGIL